MAECYMCSSPSVAPEHVPPKCIFPEPKDLPPGTELRKNLITVPACPDHNLKKSLDDQYLFYVLASSHPINQIGHLQAGSKLYRSIQHNPSLMNRMLSKSAPAIAVDQDGTFETRTLVAEGSRLDSVFQMMGRALYFHHFERKWPHRIKVRPEFIFFLEGEKATEYNQALAEIRAIADAMFAPAKPVGKNPEVFRYWVVEDAPRNLCFIRLAFYGEAKVTLHFIPDGS